MKLSPLSGVEVDRTVLLSKFFNTEPSEVRIAFYLISIKIHFLRDDFIDDLFLKINNIF